VELIGIFGGTFDPIHVGHLRSALELLDRLDLEQIRFVPCRAPHHQKMPSASADLRLQMVRAAVAPESKFIVDERELHRRGPSYSIDTLESLRQEFPEHIFALIVGMDAFAAFDSWHRWQDILKLAHIIAARRPGSDVPTGAIGELLASRGVSASAELRTSRAGGILVHTVTQLEISSSAIREMVGRGEDPRFLVPEPVRQIINTSGCYTGKVKKGDSFSAE